MRGPSQRRFFAREVIQATHTDCGPAALKCLLEGFGIPASYGRLREACQTDVDGTSIDALEEVAQALGLEAEQTMVPVDDLFRAGAALLPAVAVVWLPSGSTHFVVLWRKLGGWVQVMDPSVGRHWVPVAALARTLYRHAQRVPADDWRQWAATAEGSAPLRERLESLGISADPVIDWALADPSWRSLATLDAATRMTTAVVDAGGLARGRDAQRMMQLLLDNPDPAGLDDTSRTMLLQGGPGPAGLDRAPRLGAPRIPDAYWAVRPVPPDRLHPASLATVPPDRADPANLAAVALDLSANTRPIDQELMLRGAVLVRVLGRRADRAPGTTSRETVPLSPELAAALGERPKSPLRHILDLLREDGWLSPAVILGGALLAATGAALEALLLRGLFDLGRELGSPEQRLLGMGAVALLAVVLLLLEFPLASETLRLGRRLELRFRIAFLRKLPALSDRYFHSRPTSDMAERGHTVHRIRALPDLGRQVVERSLQLVATTVGIMWIAPAAAPLAFALAATSVLIPLVAQPALSEKDLRVRNHNGALGRFYLDALLGLIPLRAHGGEAALRIEHEAQLTEWVRSGRALQTAVLWVQGAQAVVGYGLAGALLIVYLAGSGPLGGALLLFYWTMSVPRLGGDLAAVLRQYPARRSALVRLIEPLGALEEPIAATAPAAATALAPTATTETARAGVAIVIRGVSVKAAGHVLLADVSLELPAGSHVAIVGPSGAGKSSLVGLALGWHRPAGGELLVDGEPLDRARLDWLRPRTAWVDASVQLWNRSFLENLEYGAPAADALPLGRVLEEAELHGVLESLPDGMESLLGESGALVSGGEGQRVRLARAMRRWQARLVILDEPFRGIERERRRRLLARCRKSWARATLLYITHDLEEARAFDRTIVVEAGRIVEDGAPEALLARSGSRYRAMFDEDRRARDELWRAGAWRRIALRSGALVELDSVHRVRAGGAAGD